MSSFGNNNNYTLDFIQLTNDMQKFNINSNMLIHIKIIQKCFT